MGRTHVLLGTATAWWVQAAMLPASVAPACLAAGALGALLPDLDAPTSLLQGIAVGGIRPFRLLGNVAAPFGHRGLLHSRLGLAILAGLAAPLMLWSWPAWLSLLLGYASHLAADACTRGGIRWRYPGPERSYLLPPRLRFVTGSPPEDAVFALAACAVLFLALRLLLPPGGATYP